MASAGPFRLLRPRRQRGEKRQHLGRPSDPDLDHPIVYTVASSPIPELDREPGRAIASISVGYRGGELFMTNGPPAPRPRGEV